MRNRLCQRPFSALDASSIKPQARQLRALIAGWYELTKNDKDQYTFVLKAGNSEMILRGEQYETKAAVQNGIVSVQTHVPSVTFTDNT